MIEARPLKKEDIYPIDSGVLDDYIRKDRVLGLVEWLKQEIVNLREREPMILMDDINNILDEGVKQIKDEVRG